jgi:tRNA (mo5U34)-methyltransferase
MTIPPTSAAAALARELSEPPGWMYPWQLGEGLQDPSLPDELRRVHETRRDLIEGPARRALAGAGPGARALDIACNEGWFSHLLLEWGAAEVVGTDIRELNVRRARLVRDHLGVPEERMSLLDADLFDMTPERFGTFDVVLLLGLIYHVEDPIGAIRRALALTRGILVIETQLSRQVEPISFGAGSSTCLLSSPASFALHIDADRERDRQAAAEGRASLVPNLAALERCVQVAGGGPLEPLEPAPHHDLQYLVRDRMVAVVRPAR